MTNNFTRRTAIGLGSAAVAITVAEPAFAEESNLDASPGLERIRAHYIARKAPKTLLLQVVAQANRCRAVWMKRY